MKNTKLANLQSKFPFEPQNYNLIVEGFQEAEKVGSIIIPESSQRSLTQGMVIKVSKQVSLDIKPGDIVIFGLHTESKIVIDGTSFLVIQQENIYASMSNESEK